MYAIIYNSIDNTHNLDVITRVVTVTWPSLKDPLEGKKSGKSPAEIRTRTHTYASTPPVLSPGGILAGSLRGPVPRGKEA